MGHRGFTYALDFCGGTTKRSLTSAELAPRVPLLPWYFLNQVILNRNRNPELVEITKTGNLVLRMKLF